MPTGEGQGPAGQPPGLLYGVRALLLGERLDTRGLERTEPLAAAPLTLRLSDESIAIFFRYGGVVLFGATAAAESALLRRLQPFVIGPFQQQESEDTRLRIGPDPEEGIDAAGDIVIRNGSAERFQLVADVLAKSLVLTHYETRIAQIFDRIEPLAATLREKGRAGPAGKALLRQIGDVLLIQHRMVGRVETSEKPDLLWDHPELERLYLRLAEDYELRERSRALDRKLDLIARTVETLLGLVQNRSSLRVEWYILVLVGAELALMIYPLFLGR
jgi:required for meiotic nuclear division protein 1